MGNRKGMKMSKTPGQPPKTKPASLSEVIREGLKKLGDPDAKASEVRKAVLEMFPSMRKAVEGQKNWNSYVTQNRDKAAEEMSVDRKRRSGSRLSYADYQAGQKLVEEFGGGKVEKAIELLDVLAERDIDRLRKAVDAWGSLVESAGSSETALNVLETMREKRAIW